MSTTEERANEEWVAEPHQSSERLPESASAPAIREVAARPGRGSVVGEAFASPIRLGRTITEVSYNSGVFGRNFTRAEVLAVLKSRKIALEYRVANSDAAGELSALIHIFENME